MSPAENPAIERIRSASEQERIQKGLLIRGNTLGGVVASALEIVAMGGDVPQEQLASLADDLRAWTADVRAVSSEEAP